MTQAASTNSVTIDGSSPGGRATIDVSVSIVTYNSNRYIADLIDSIERSKGTLRMEMLVAENASSEAAALAELLAAKYPHVIFERHSRNRFFTYADNQNMRKARGRYLLSINPDSRCLEDAIVRMVDFLDRNSDVGAITPRIIRSDGTLRPSSGRFPTARWGLLEAGLVNALWPGNRTNRLIMTPEITYDPSRLADVEVLYGACIMVRREVLSTAGYKDEKLVHGWDEYDWSRRIQRAGWRTCYFPDATIQHVENASRTTLNKAQSKQLGDLEFAALFHLYRKYFNPVVWIGMKLLSYSVRPALKVVMKAYIVLRRCVPPVRAT